MTETEKKLVEVLKLAQYALNQIPNTRVPHDKFRNSYEVAAEIDRVLGSLPPQENP